jgi:hypothetical protein
MSQFTTSFQLPLLVPGLAGHVPHNRSMRWLDLICGQGVVEDTDTAPASPAEGAAYIVTGTPVSGSPWFGKAKQIALRSGGAWLFLNPVDGVRLWNRADGCEWVFNATNWEPGGTGAWKLGNANMTGGWAQMPIASTIQDRPRSLPRTTNDIRTVLAGVYECHLNAMIDNSNTAGTTILEVAFSKSSSTGGVTPEAGSVRTISFAQDYSHTMDCLFVVQTAALDYLSPIWRRVSGSGTLALAADSGMLTIKPLSR